ncbi:MAG: hypothetical protein MJ229_02800 [bacterium]|nr:hypothetical protein [bacterium]
MKKLKNILFILIISLFCLQSPTLADDIQLRNYDGIELAKGTFISVMITKEVSTFYDDVGAKVEFLVNTDTFLRDINIIPKNSKFFGYISNINDPIVGSDASMVIKIVKLQLPDGFEMPVKGYIYSPKANILGGNATEPASYITKVSKRQGMPYQLGFVPGATLKMGKHYSIAAGTDLLVVLVAPLYITHTVTN